MRSLIDLRLCGLGGVCALWVGAGVALGQPGYMHQRLIGLSGIELFRDVRTTPLFDPQATDDFGSVSTGDIRSATNALSDVLLVKKDPTGNVLWSQFIPSANLDEHGYKVAVEANAANPGVIACVYTGNTFPGFQTGMVQVTPLGALISSFWLRGTGQPEFVNNRDVGVSIRVIKPTDRLVTANVVSTLALSEQGVLIRTTPGGLPMWTMRYSQPAGLPQRVSFSDVTELPPSPVIGQMFLVVGTIADPNNVKSILALVVNGGGGIVTAWQISLPAGFVGALYGDGVDTTHTGNAVISGRYVVDPTDPLGVANLLIRFDPLAGGIIWSTVHRQLVPGRAAVQWREGCARGAAVAGEWRAMNAAGGITNQPAVLMTDDGGGPTMLVTHTDSFKARHDGIAHFEGTYGARVLADGWGDFSPMGYGLDDALTVRTDQIAMTVFCPMTFPGGPSDLPLFVVHPQIAQFQDTGFEQAIPPTFITVRDDQACRAGACDTIDFNNDGIFPDIQDLNDFLNVFGGGACSTGCCNDIDYNNDGIFPDIADLNDYLNAFGGLPC